ncbi:DUF2059 domain-containing protein [Noviherbaspirillum saxi]|uniref:DUF2059 domain-containing protein n=1 Tax=Noviherbaspirillum saxi TaxID=2320863 RepID=A0A3A3FTJ4_9BURK|nr:DUF2059 domain-containing protein [Noviherbaspirillum saxi]RJF99502.1 DUF2059 domain-containing protein [Noviherbaspirillum saxi]
MIKPVFAIAMMTAALHVQAASPAKQELVQKVLQLWQIESVGQLMLQEPVNEAVAQARVVLQGRVAPERQEAAMRDITTDAKKFIDETSPVVLGSTKKLVPSTVAPLLAERFSEEELTQIVAILESPVRQKFEAMMPEMQKTLGEKLAADTRPVIDPKLQDLRQRIGLRLRTAAMP